MTKKSKSDIETRVWETKLDEKKDACIEVEVNKDTRLVFDDFIKMNAIEFKIKLGINSIAQLSDKFIIESEKNADPKTILLLSDLMKNAKVSENNKE